MPRVQLAQYKWVVVGHNPDGSPYAISCDTEAEARKVAKEVKGTVKTPINKRKARRKCESRQS